jgi:hypothetical protein
MGETCSLVSTACLERHGATSEPRDAVSYRTAPIAHMSPFWPDVVWCDRWDHNNGHTQSRTVHDGLRLI